MESTIKDLLERRSCRKYRKEQIREEELDIILKAGTYAPSAKNLQSSIIVAVQNREDYETLRRLNAGFTGHDGDPFYGAPTVCVVLGDRNCRNYERDGSLVIGNMLNAAHALGIGSCWINRADMTFETEEGRALLRKWGIEGDYAGVGNVILGYMDCENPEPKPRKEHFIYKIK